MLNNVTFSFLCAVNFLLLPFMVYRANAQEISQKIYEDTPSPMRQNESAINRVRMQGGSQEAKNESKSGMEFLRTPENRFENLPGYPFAPHYVYVDDYEGGQLRMHYVDEGPKDAPTLLMIHGNPTWSYLFRDVLPYLNDAGYRTIMIDLIGMGRSDKPTQIDDYTYDRHLGWVKQMFDHLDATLNLGQVVIFGHDYGTPLGIRLMNEHYPTRFDGFINANASLPDGDHVSPVHRRWRRFVRNRPRVPVGHLVTANVDPPLNSREIYAYYAPFPDVSYMAAVRSFPEMVPDTPDEPEAIANIKAWGYMETFSKPFMTIFGQYDPVMFPSARMEFIDRVPGAYGQPHAQLDVKHYAPEDKPQEVAEAVIQFLSDLYNPKSFVALQYADFESGFDGFVPSGGSVQHDANRGTVEIRGNRKDSSIGQENPMNLTDYEALKVAFRYRPSGMEQGENLMVELWNGSAWIQVLGLTSGVDFRNGALDYGYVRLDRSQIDFAADAKVRLRIESSDSSNVISLLDVGIYGRPR